MNHLTHFAACTYNSLGIPECDADLGIITGTVLPLVFALMGGLSLLFVVIGAFRYVLSAGEPKNTQAARETIIYALVGLMVSVSAFTIVGFVIENVDTAVGEGALIGPEGIITKVTELLIWAIGLVSIIMILVGALRFVISVGDPAGTKAARDTILYAVVGLVIAIAAQSIVTFVLDAL